MKAVILAAGAGSRLRPITDDRPKCLVPVGGVPILEHQLRALSAAGVTDVAIVTGYRGEAVKAQVSSARGMRVRLLENPEFQVTNNMYSLYLARHFLAGGGLLLNGDVVFDPTIVHDLLRAPAGDLIAVDRASYLEESMKLVVSPEGVVTDISKEIPADAAYGSSIDVYRLSPIGAQRLVEQVCEFVERQGRRREWTEVAIQRLLQMGTLEARPFDIGKRAWVEIDDENDLARAERLFADGGDRRSDAARRLAKKLLFVDLDGTVYLGNQALPGAAEWLRRVERHGIICYFLSNNSSRSKGDYVRKLAGMGIACSEEQIVLSTDGVIEYLRKEDLRNVFVLGTQALSSSLARAGMNVTAAVPECVVAGYDTELTYAKLCRAALLLQDGVRFVATHCDLVCPTPVGPIPDIGSLLALLEAATGRRPDRVFGKPNAEMVSHLLVRHGATPDTVAVVGDRLYTDFELARRVGCDFVLVLSGEAKRADVETRADRPALIANRLGDIDLETWIPLEVAAL